MGRTVVTQSDIDLAKRLRQGTLGDPSEGPPATPEPDAYFGRLVKYVPPDVIAAFLALEGAIGAAQDSHKVLAAWIIFGIILLATPAYLWRVGGIRKPVQVVIATVAFVIWSVAYPGLPFSAIGVTPLYGTLLVGLYTFLIPLVQV